MCFYSKNNTRKSNKTDHIVYKRMRLEVKGQPRLEKNKLVCDMQLVSEHRGHVYKIGKVYKSPLIDNNAHKKNYTSASVDKGFHSWIDAPVPGKPVNHHYVMVECIIPKGSEYYIDPVRKEKVSNQIKVVKILWNTRR